MRHQHFASIELHSIPHADNQLKKKPRHEATVFLSFIPRFYLYVAGPVIP